jgi:hypothetical protein
MMSSTWDCGKYKDKKRRRKRGKRSEKKRMMKL